ncbi:MAG: helix-hairpin-helix domain-containing protein [Bacteroidaceae bacterium]|nr:helix-hairpin-helix domain-containing protein [Bacteroidaceae bacterium]
MSWDDFIQTLAYDSENIADGEWTDYLELLEWLHSHPMNINTATPEEMAALPFLTPSQIEAIQAYVHLNGTMLSLGELALIPALDSQIRRVIPLFFTAEPPKNGHTGKEKKGFHLQHMTHTLDTRMDIPMYYRKGYQTGAYIGNPLYSRIRYAVTGRHVEAGVHVKKDPGERFYDSYGGYATIRDKGVLKTAIIGDYRAGWGEGLVINSARPWGKTTMTSGIGRGVRPMTGVSESGFLRGVAVTLATRTCTDDNRTSRPTVSGTLFFSHKALDATLNDKGEVQTLVTNGYHRTDTELNKKENTLTTVTGAHIQTTVGHFTIGATGYWQHFNRILAPGNATYRQWLPRGQDFGIAGIHFGYSHYKWSGSTEVAYSTSNGGVAALARMQKLVNRNLKFSALGRYYDYRYHSFMASAISENSGVQNETGAMLTIEARPLTRLVMTAFADFFFHYWPRYGMTTSDNGQEMMTEWIWETTEIHALSFRYRIKRKAANDAMTAHHHLRAQWTCRPSEKWRLQSTVTLHLASGSRPGIGIGQLLHGRTSRVKTLRFSLMAGYFHAPDYGTRIYIYEPALRNSTAPSMYYGHGMRLVSTIRYVFPHSHWMTEVRYAMTHMFDRNSISSGNQEILSPTKQDVSIQIAMEY